MGQLRAVRYAAATIAQRDVAIPAARFVMSHGISPKKVFVATPISSFASDHEYALFRDYLLATLTLLREENSIAAVYCAAEHVAVAQLGGDPVDATRRDLAALQAATHFVLIYPAKIASSVLIELGYALALQQTIVVICRSPMDLPFAARAFDRIYANVMIKTVAEFDVESAHVIIEALA